MNRETEMHFSELPAIDIKRSKFNRPKSYKTTFNAADIIPIYNQEVLPGDTVNMKMAELVRMSTPVYPVMDDAAIDIMFYFVPNRLLWNHWKEFWGENNSTAWEQSVEYEIPQIKAPTGGWASGTLADYFGLPTKVENIEVNHLPFRAYCKIWNDWYRDENLKDPCMINLDETTLTGTNSGDYVINAQLGAKPLKAAKYHDRFTSALPAPQKGPAVEIPIGGIAPVIGTEEIGTGEQVATNFVGKKLEFMNYMNGGAWVGTMLSTDTTAARQGSKMIGLGVDLNEAVGGFNINALRTAFAIQRFYEAQARGGSRYIEFLKNIFGVTSPDGRQQRSEYLGGKRIPINVDQVIQTSSTDTTSPQGNVAAYSVTTNSDEYFTKSFTEHGILMGVAIIRTNHTYQNVIEKQWSRKKWSDFYVPQFANLGEQAIYNKEIYATGTETDDEVFGYQEAWSEYRYDTNMVTGAFRSNYTGSLDSWHYADNYTTTPSLSSEWIDETAENIDRTLAVSSSVEHQFLADFYFNPTWVRPMPVYSVPGLLDHH